jgi:hypothetical protein
MKSDGQNIKKTIKNLKCLTINSGCDKEAAWPIRDESYFPLPSNLIRDNLIKLLK